MDPEKLDPAGERRLYAATIPIFSTFVWRHEAAATRFSATSYVVIGAAVPAMNCLFLSPTQ